MKKCNVCGKNLDTFDKQSGIAIEQNIGYGSKYDGMILNLHLCCSCMDSLIAACKISPVRESGEKRAADEYQNRIAENLSHITITEK